MEYERKFNEDIQKTMQRYTQLTREILGYRPHTTIDEVIYTQGKK